MGKRETGSAWSSLFLSLSLPFSLQLLQWVKSLKWKMSVICQALACSLNCKALLTTWGTSMVSQVPHAVWHESWPFLAAAKDWFLTLPFLYTASNIFNANQRCSVVKSCLYFICLLFLHIAAGKSCQRSCGWKHGPCRCWPQAQLLPSQPDVAFCSVTLNVKHVDNGIVYMRLERGMWYYEACFRWHIVDRRGQWEQFWAGLTLKGWDFCVLWSVWVSLARRQLTSLQSKTGCELVYVQFRQSGNDPARYCNGLLWCLA